MSLLLGYLYLQKRLGYLRLWMWMWILVALHYFAPAARRWVPFQPWETAFDSFALAVAALLLLLSAQAYSQGRLRIRLAVAAGAIFAVWAVGNSLGRIAVPPQFGTGFLLFLAARSFWEEGQQQESRTECILAGALVAWGFTLIGLVLNQRLRWATPDVHLQLPCSRKHLPVCFSLFPCMGRKSAESSATCSRSPT